MTKRFLLEDGTEIFAQDDAVLTSDGLIYPDQEHKSSRPMTDKHQALRDTLDISETHGGRRGTVVGLMIPPGNLRALLADHDYMRETLQNIADMCECCYSLNSALGVAIETLKECGQ